MATQTPADQPGEHRDSRKAMTLRLPPHLMQDLKLAALFTGKTANEIVTNLVAEYVTSPQARSVIASAMTERAQQQYGEALATLAETEEQSP
jgi:uncharacterized protein involved in type VI secretion and phage assembly